MEGKISYTEACSMSEDDLEEANAALDIYIDLIIEQRNEGGKK
ncbi:hypothetical protein [Alkaliphilus metalliredigens]|nr:hypothetical protein [Alkaliphilus metalliredigens]